MATGIWRYSTFDISIPDHMKVETRPKLLHFRNSRQQPTLHSIILTFLVIDHTISATMFLGGLFISDGV